MIKSRALSSALKSKSESRFGRIIVLTGARQTGKTTLARKCFPEFKYLSIEDPVTRGDYTQLTAGQWHERFPKAILDEVQKEPVLIESIKSVYDQHEDTSYILLGSSQLLLLQKIKESLAGRCSIFEVFPLTIPELLSNNWETQVQPSFFQTFIGAGILPDTSYPFRLHPKYPEIMEAYNHYLQFGGYPALSDPTLHNNEREDWLRNYIQTYLERDVRDLADFRNLEPFIQIQRTTALLTGNVLNFSLLAREAGVSANTAHRFLHYLELSYQAILLKPWYRNHLKRLTRSPNIHYLDPGIQRTIIRKQGGMSGNEFESAIIAEIFKQTRHLRFSGDLYHLRTVDGREMDLLIELENGYVAIEIKMTTKVSGTDARHLKGLAEILDKPLMQSFVISNDTEVKDFGENVIAMPAAMFLS
ncbi:MAG: AAA family ATPase [Bacteroidetes bacterium]|nr:AAA family ATPase [Bacteroidota bacterium]